MGPGAKWFEAWESATQEPEQEVAPSKARQYIHLYTFLVSNTSP